MNLLKNSIIEKKLKNIIKTVDNNIYNNNNGLMGGNFGFCLLFFFYSKYTNNYSYFKKGYYLLNNIINNKILSINNTSLSGGISGIYWGLLTIMKIGLIESDINKKIEQIDIILLKKMINQINEQNFDFLHGALGISLYFINRDNVKSKKYLNELLFSLDKLSICNNIKLKWISINNITKKKNFNISMSHGISSIIAILSKIYKRGINKEKTKYLLEGAVNYLLKQKLPKGQYNSIFSYLAIESMDNLSSSRLAWCYGDLGISVAIWHASQALGRKDWEQEAIKILLHSAKRRNLKENGVVDAGLCHGTAGIAHIFNRMYGYTGIEELKDASIYWFDQTLKMARFDDGLAGYKAWQGKRGWVNEPGLLEGIAGIGLALISAVSNIEPCWDECLLLS